MSNFWIGGLISLIAVAYGVGMWYVGIVMGIDLMRRNPPPQAETARHLSSRERKEEAP